MKFKKHFLIRITQLLIGVGLCFSAVPFIKYLGPSKDSFNQYPSFRPNITVDIKELDEGDFKVVLYKGLPVIIYRRTREDIQNIIATNEYVYDPFSKDQYRWTYSKPKDVFLKESFLKSPFRSIKKDIFVASLVSPIFSCQVIRLQKGDRAETLKSRIESETIKWFGGYVDPCNDVYYGTAGRVYFGNSNGLHMRIPKHEFTDKNTIVFP